MVDRSYWLDLFTAKTWNEFLDAGGSVSGFREGKWKAVQRIREGDYLLCYLTGVSRWIGVLEVTGRAFRDDTPIWPDDDFPCRVPVRVIAALNPETAVPVLLMRDELSVFKDIKNPNRWSGPFRGSPQKWSRADGERVVEVVLDAQEHPVERPVDAKKLGYRPRAVETDIGSVTVPEPEDEAEENFVPEVTQATPHTEVQALLLRLGASMGLDVWIARNDRTKEWNGQRLAELPRNRTELPKQFDPMTQRIIELIDVLWLDGNAIVAAFEVEHTTSVYSGLLRMADLLALQPNLNIPLFLVAPDERRSKVIAEINRPTFSKLSPPLVEVCRFISFTALRDQMKLAEPFLRYIKPEFLQEISESCEPDES